MLKWNVTVIVMLICGSSFSQNLKTYQIFTKEGKEVTFEKMMKDLSKNNVVLFGELHNNALGHWFELQVTKALYEQNPNLTLGAEMFETDAQLVLNEYLQGHIKVSHLETEGKVWKNFSTDYLPLVDFAKDHSLPFIATNIPRRYANFIYRNGLEALENLDEQAHAYIAPLPIDVDLELPGYKNMIESMGAHMPGGSSAENLAKSQASKDATMAWFIVQHMKGGVFVHYNGSYHSNNFDGINHYLREYKPGIAIGTINMVEQDSLDELKADHLNTADYILVIPGDMTKTY